MSSADFRHIAVKGKARREERLFRAAVSAFCALTRPTRSETAQMEELTLQLFDMQTKESKRFAAAALSEAAGTANALIRRLCEEPVDVAAPLLIRSPALADVDLIALIGRHGVAHARAIARRKDLHPTIAALIRALEAQQTVGHAVPEEKEENVVTEDQPVSRPLFGTASRSPEETGAAAERMRERLRSFMAPAAAMAPGSRPAAGPCERLKMTALAGNAAFFQTALADALGIDFSVARDIATGGGYTGMTAALKVLKLTEEQAFLVTAAVFPTFFQHAEAVRLFVERYRQMDRAAALDMVRGWRAESAARSFLRAQPAADNSDLPAARVTRLRVS